MSEVVSMTGHEWTDRQVHQNTGRLVPVQNVLNGAANADLDEVLVVGRLPDGTLYVAGSHNTAYSALLAAQAEHVIVRAVRLSGDEYESA